MSYSMYPPTMIPLEQQLYHLGMTTRCSKVKGCHTTRGTSVDIDAVTWQRSSALSGKQQELVSNINKVRIRERQCCPFGGGRGKEHLCLGIEGNKASFIREELSTHCGSPKTSLKFCRSLCALKLLKACMCIFY